MTPQLRRGLAKDLEKVSRAFLERQTESLLISPIILLQFLIFCSIWMLKSNFESKTKRKCFWCGHGARILLLNVTGWYAHVYDIWKKITSFACFFGSSLNWILHWCAQFFVLFKSEFRVFREFFYQWFLKKVNWNQRRFYILT